MRSFASFATSKVYWNSYKWKLKKKKITSRKIFLLNSNWKSALKFTFMVAENLHTRFSVRVICWFETKFCDTWKYKNIYLYQKSEGRRNLVPIYQCAK